MCTEFCDPKDNNKNRIKKDFIGNRFGRSEKLSIQPQLQAGVDYKPRKDLDASQNLVIQKWMPDQLPQQAVNAPFQATSVGIHFRF